MPGDGDLYFGGEIYTVDDARPTAEAVGVRGGRIVAVGSETECRTVLGEDFSAVDLAGRALLPGFIDTHLHPLMLVYFDMNIDLSGATSISEVQARLRSAASEATENGWVVGLRFDEEALDAPRLPTRHDLDAASSDHPLVVVKHDGHMVIANSRAIEAAGVSASTRDPEGGAIDREADGHPSGPFRETATAMLLCAMPLPELEVFVANARASFAKLASYGITSAGVILQTDEEGPAGSQGALDVPALQMLLPQIPLTLYGLAMGGNIERVAEARDTPLHDPLAGHRIGGIKIIADGTFGSRTACMREPFSDAPDRTGFMTLDEGEIYRRMVAAHTRGLQIATHAIGDDANRRCIDLYDRLLTEYPRADHRHRLEHASLLDTAMIADLARLGLIVSTQPLFIHSEKGWLHKRLGAERAKAVYPLRDLFEAQVKVAGASDAPVESPDVLHAIQCCVTREAFEPQQGITAAQAVRMYTIDAAFAQFDELAKGSISVGKRADLVILTANPVAVPPHAIRDIRVERTIMGGRIIYDRAQQT